MTDQYWNRLLAKYTEMTQLGAAHPSAVFPDPSLGSLLEASVEGEEDYTPPAVHTRDLPLGEGAESFQIRVYTPATPESSNRARALFVWVHGGAWAFGDLEGGEGDATAREVAARADAVVIAIDYRLARAGVHYPVPLDDVITAYRWAVAHCDELGVDPARIVLGGASAGGNLAAGAVLRLADEGDTMPAGIVLAYPTLHAVLPPASAELQARLDRMSAASGFKPEIYTPIVENYLGGPADAAPPNAMPGVADDLSVFPPTYIFNCEFDGLRASGERFAEQLRDAGVPVRSETVRGVAHAHLARPGLPQARQSHADLAAWVAARVAQPV
jgi:acetyl esterase